MAKLEHITQEVLHRVHEVTGVPVLVQPDPTLTVLATMKMARGAAPAHVVSYNPQTANADYAVCYQCGFIIRIFTTPEDQRFDVAGTYRGRKDAEHMVNEQLRPMSLSREQLLSFRDQIYDGLIRQLRSVPVGLRVDAWLSQEYPALADQQRVMVSRQLQDNTAALGAEIRRLAPAKILTANVTMNAAFAAFWSRQWSEPVLIAPYKLTGNLGEGEELLRLLDVTPQAPAHDRDLIASWGQRLGLEGWFEFVAFQQN